LTFSQEYQEPTNEQLTNWWASLSTEERLIELRKLDRLENLPLTIEKFDYGALLTTDGHLIIFPEENIVKIQLDYLEYEVELPTSKISNFVIPEENNMLFIIAIGTGCLSVGLIIGLLF
jgi:hypothetical protein